MGRLDSSDCCSITSPSLRERKQNDNHNIEEAIDNPKMLQATSGADADAGDCQLQRSRVES